MLSQPHIFWMFCFQAVYKLSQRHPKLLHGTVAPANSNGSSNCRLIDRSFGGSTSARCSIKCSKCSTSELYIHCILIISLHFSVRSEKLHSFFVRKRNTTPARLKAFKMVLFFVLGNSKRKCQAQAPHFEKQHANGLCCAVTCRIKDPRPGSCDARRKARVYTIYIQSSPNIVNYRRNHL